MDLERIVSAGARAGARPMACRELGGRLLAATLAGCLSALAVPLAVAQSVTAWPSKPLKLIVPFPAGGSGDVLARLVAQPMSVSLGQPIVVENRPGGGSVIAAEAVIRSGNDGHTVLLSANSVILAPLLRPTISFDALRDLVGVTQLVSSPMLLVVQSSSPWRSTPALLEAARATPGKLMLGALGPGGTQHVAGEMFKAAARIDMTYVPYAGGAPAVNALLGGHVDAVIANHSEVGQQIEAGRIRPLAVIAPERIGAFADVPTMGELGLPSVNAVVWFGLNVPSGSPAVAVQRLHDEAVRALRSPEVAAKLATIGMQPVGSTSAAFDRHMRAESERFARIIASAGIKAE